MARQTGHSAFSFGTDHGTFVVIGELEDPGDFRLVLRADGDEPRELGRFRTLGEAISAVAQQETGFPPWDELAETAVPHRMHDLACWDFFNFPGTNPGAGASH